MKSHIEKIEKSLKIALIDNTDIILQKDDEIKLLNIKLSQSISKNNSIESLNIENSNKIINLYNQISDKNLMIDEIKIENITLLKQIGEKDTVKNNDNS